MTSGYDRAAIMRDAHKRYADGKRIGLGWTFGRCLATAWAAAKMRREIAGLRLAA
jgi:gamma-glutamyl phosphate reductase